MDNMFFSITENGNRNEIPISDDGVKIIENWCRLSERLRKLPPEV